MTFSGELRRGPHRRVSRSRARAAYLNLRRGESLPELAAPTLGSHERSSSRPLTSPPKFSDDQILSSATDLTSGRSQSFVLRRLSGDLGSAMDEFIAVHLSPTGTFDLEFFVETQCALAVAFGRDPDAILYTSCFFELVAIVAAGSHPARDVLMRWQSVQKVVKQTTPEVLAPALRRIVRNILEGRRAARHTSKQGGRALLDTQQRTRALINTFSEERGELQRQREIKAVERQALKFRRQAAEQNVLAMFALERGDREAQMKARDSEFRFLRQAAEAEAEVRRRTGNVAGKTALPPVPSSPTA